VLQPRVVDLNSLIHGLENMLQRLIGEDIRLGIAVSSAPATIRADPGQIEQVILNLAVNARDAMPDGGELFIESALVDLDAAMAAERPPLTPGPRVVLIVSDTGVGMDAETRAHIFEPFFTTKEHGKGTGLGLATVYGIVKQSDGYVWAESEPGEGATFTIYLPFVDEAPHAAAEFASAERDGVCRETVLVVEDEARVREIVGRILTRRGYSVLVAPDGPTAFAIAHAHAGPIDLLLTDVVMPGMTGYELATKLTAARPAVRVLFMSGYTDDAAFRHGLQEADAHYIQKPFAGPSLIRKVRKVLDAPA